VETPPPSRWFEECLAEAFAIRGLASLADGWERNPPFPNDLRYAQAIRDYRRALIEKYRSAAGPEGAKDMAAWLRDNRKGLDETTGLGVYTGPAILTIVTALENDKGCRGFWRGQPLAAAQRRSARGLFTAVAGSCVQLAVPGRLPKRLQDAFGCASPT
jgi:hypothetical protein